MEHTVHSRTRCQQRAIRSDVLGVLMEYGEEGYRRGAEVRFMNRSGRERARRELGAKIYARLESQLNAYLVVSHEGRLITAGRRRTRLKF